MIKGEWRNTGDGISGWAMNSQTDMPLWVELLADGQSLGVALANLPEPNGCGFWLPIPGGALDDAERLEVGIANLDARLTQKNADTPEKTDAPDMGLAGELQVDRGLTISGWVLDPAKTDQKLVISAFINGVEKASTVAGTRQYRPAQADGHGFALSLPESLADGKCHTVEVKDMRGRHVPGSPFRICTLPENASVWLKNHKKPDKPLLEAISNIFELMEERLPGLHSRQNYPAWKKAFPVEPPAKRQKAAIFAPGAEKLLSGQQGGELRPRKNDAEYRLFPGGAVKLHPYALAKMIEAMRETGAEAAYADAEDENGLPLFKPAWDREAFLARDYAGPLLVLSSLAARAGLDKSESESAQRAKLLLTAEKTVHVPQILSHAPLSAPSAERDRIINDWLSTAHPGSRCLNGRVTYGLCETPRISIIIPTRDHGDLLKTCLDSLASTDWPDYEIIIVDNGSVEDAALAVMANAENSPNICVFRRPGVFNYSAINNEAAALASGALLCFLNNDTEALHPEWLREMASLLLMSGESGGAVGAKLLWPNGLVQHGGVIVGTHQLAAHVGNQWLDDEPGYMGRNQFAQRYSAVTAACLLTPRKLFLESGGFDMRRFPIAFNDIDYCLRIGAQGKKIFWTPHARLAHHESASRGEDKYGSARARADREIGYFRIQWGYFDDPFYNPNLPLSAGAPPFTGVAFPPRPRNAR